MRRTLPLHNTAAAMVAAVADLTVAVATWVVAVTIAPRAEDTLTLAEATAVLRHPRDLIPGLAAAPRWRVVYIQAPLGDPMPTPAVPPECHHPTAHIQEIAALLETGQAFLLLGRTASGTRLAG